jgi:hypothetical protein
MTLKQLNDLKSKNWYNNQQMTRKEQMLRKYIQIQ